ncbi:MAG: hypothetical protein ABIJ41_05760 [Candidatus Omnitrophota bacterium]
MKKQTFKNCVYFFIPFLLCYCFALFFAILKNNYAQNIGQIVSQTAGPWISMKRVTLSPLTGIKIENIRFGDSQRAYLSMGSITLKHSFIELFRNRLVLRDIVVDHARIDLPPFQEQIVADRFFSSLDDAQKQDEKSVPGVSFRDAKICFRDLQINFPQKDSQGQRLTLVVNFCIDQQKNRMICDGWVHSEKSTAISWYFKNKNLQNIFKRNRFTLDVERIGPDIMVNKVGLFVRDGSFSGSGIIENFPVQPKINIKLYSNDVRLDHMDAFKEFKPAGGGIRYIAQLAGELSDLNLKSELAMPTVRLTFDKDLLLIDHFSCLADYRFKDKTLTVKEMRGILDNQFALSIKGSVKDFARPFWNLRMSVSALQKAKEKESDASFLQAGLKGQTVGPQFKGQLSLAGRNSEKTRQYTLSLSDFIFSRENQTKEQSQISLQISSLELIASETTDQGVLEAQSFGFKDAHASLSFIGRKTEIHDLQFNGYGGQVHIKGHVNINPQKKDYSLMLKADQLHLVDVKLLAPLKGRMSGNFSGVILLNEKKGPSVKGLVQADQFELSELEPLDKVADFIGIPSIKTINDAQILCDFESSANESRIRRFDFDGPDIAMRSSFDVAVNSWLEGHVALSLPRKLLAQSKIFRKLMAIAREREDRLDFVVHLSGFEGGLRTELVKSDFRDKLKDKVSEGIQKYIENEANKAIQENPNP